MVNNYGLSETTVVATSGAVASAGEARPTIGRAIAGVVAEVVDENLRPVGPGLPGELIIGGVAVGRGYVEPARAHDRATSCAGQGGRRYRTGDRVRLRSDGEFEFLGRTGRPAEHPGRPGRTGRNQRPLELPPGHRGQRRGGRGADERRAGAGGLRRGRWDETADRRAGRAGLDAFLGDFASRDMVPSRYVWLDELPLTAHGKVDRDALPAASSADSRRNGTEQRCPDADGGRHRSRSWPSCST